MNETARTWTEAEIEAIVERRIEVLMAELVEVMANATTKLPPLLSARPEDSDGR
jgi:hypothetical protein